MSLLKSVAIATLPVGIVCAALAAAPSKAANYQEGTILGYQAYILESGSYNRPDYMVVYGPHGEETITVTCAPFDWQSTGPNTASFVDSIARSWCF